MNEVAWCYNEGFGCKKDRVCKLLNIKNCYEPRVPNSFTNQLIDLHAYVPEVWRNAALACFPLLMTAFWAATGLP